MIESESSRQLSVGKDKFHFCYAFGIRQPFVSFQPEIWSILSYKFDEKLLP